MPDSGTIFRKALPAEALEVVPGVHSLVELNDGSLLSDDGRRSSDGGVTWSEPSALGRDMDSVRTKGAVGKGIVRLSSEAIVFTVGGLVSLSRDEGASWGEPVSAFHGEGFGGPFFLGDEMIQLSNGRLLYPAYASFHGKHPELLRENVSSRGMWRDQRYSVEGHGHVPEIYFTVIAYSDDEGTTWKMSVGDNGRANAIMGWFDEEGTPNGHRGVTGFGEATAAETTGGSVLLLARPLVNRLVYSYSGDRGENWSVVLPSALASSISPPRLRRIPQTGDLVCVWNQVAKEEIHRGYRRGRLSVAISRDSGASWECFKTIEVSEGLEDVDRIPPEYPIKMVRARQDVGRLPDGWAYFHYANVCFAGGKVYISYLRGSPRLGIAEQNLNKQERVLRIYPVDWLYE